MCKKRFAWVKKCFQHYIEIFTDLNDKIKTELLSVVKTIEDTYQTHQTNIEEMAEMLKDATHIVQVHEKFSNPDGKIQQKWRKLEFVINNKLKKLLAESEDLEKSKNWFKILEKIYDFYQQKYTGEWWYFWKKGDYLPKSFFYLPCIICDKEPNCLDKSKRSESILCTIQSSGKKKSRKSSSKNKP